MLCPPYSDQWTTEIGAWRGTEGGAGQGSGSCCHCSTGKKNTHMYHGKKGSNIAWSRKTETVWMGGCFDGFISSWFLFNVLFFGGGGGYCENSHPSLSYLKKSIKIVISK